MKAEKIIIKNLFGMFNHVIPLNTEQHITIIYGPNGIGKTVLLTLLNALFSPNYDELHRFPFSELSVYYDDTSYLRIKKNIERIAVGIKKEYKRSILTFEYKEPGKKQKSFLLEPIRSRDLYLPSRLRMWSRDIKGLIRIGPETWIFEPTQEKLSTEEVIYRFGDRLPFNVRGRQQIPDWLKKVRNLIPVHFIKADRLQSYSSNKGLEEYEEEPEAIPAVAIYSEELVNYIKEKLTEYASMSQSLDRTFPSRLVKGNSSADFTMDELKEKLKDLEKKRSRLMEAGLLDKEEIDFMELQNIDVNSRGVLSVYVKDVEKKLSVLDELTNKIDLLIKIINSRFLYKKMSIDKKHGFKFTTAEEKTISPSNLSSGEQHEIVLLYELLFKVKPNSLILIDEPELSLNVAWQQQFLKDLQEITKLSEFDVLIATHSPQIIHDKWDLTVELKGPKNEGLSHSS